MNNLAEIAIKAHEGKERKRLLDSHERARVRAKECFGALAESDLLETGKSGCFRIKNTSWNLVYGFFDGFTLWHADRKDGDTRDNRYNAWQIVDMATLGESLKSVSKTWGL